MAPQQSASIPQRKFKVFSANDMANTFISAPKPASTNKVLQPKLQQVPSRSMSKPKPKPRMDLLAPGEPVAFDAEFQKFKLKDRDWEQRLGWSAAVGSKGQVIFEAFSRYEDDDPPGTEHSLPHARFGVTWKKLRYANGALNGKDVEKHFKNIFAGRTVIIHGGDGDKAAFKHEKAFQGAARVIDTQLMYWAVQPVDGTPSLATLAKVILSKVVQGGGKGEHSPIEDATTTMELFKKKLQEMPEEEMVQAQQAREAEVARTRAANAEKREQRARAARGERALG